MSNIFNRIEKLETSNLVSKTHLILLHKIAFKAEANIVKYRKERFPILEHYWIGRYMSVKEIVEYLESLQSG